MRSKVRAALSRSIRALGVTINVRTVEKLSPKTTAVETTKKKKHNQTTKKKNNTQAMMMNTKYK